MPNDKNDMQKPDSAADPRSNRPTTIDLKASEFRSETGPAAEQATSASDSAPEDKPLPGADGDSGHDAPAPEAMRMSNTGLPWPAIGAAAAAALVFFVVGFGAAQWLAGRTVTPVTNVEAASFAPNPEMLMRLGKLESALAAPRPDDPQLLARIAAAEAAAKTAADIAAARERRNDEIAAMAREARDRAASAVATAEAAQKTQPAAPQSRADIDGLTSRMAALEQSARSSEAELKRRATVSADDTRSRLAIASIALRNAVESGTPFTAELSAVKSLSGDARAVAALEPFAASGVPAASALGRELAALMPSIWKAARAQETPDGTFLERLQANAGKVVRIRPAGDAAGDDPANVKARIETRAESADIRGALSELAKLPPDARAPAQAWIAKAEARNAAIAAARDLSQTALNALARSGS